MADADALKREFSVFARYLGSGEAAQALAPQYVVMQPSMLRESVASKDGWLVAFARTGVAATALADAYARLASPYGVLRRKLVLTLALLESAGATHAQYDSARPEPRARTLLSLALLGARWALVTLAAIVVLAPLHLAAGAGRLAGWRPSHEPSRG